MTTQKNQNNIAIIGLGYVGLPLMREFSKKFDTIGFDISKRRIESLKKGKDETNELTAKDLSRLSNKFTSQEEDITNCNIYIITVPTPINKNKTPDLSPLNLACKIIGPKLNDQDLVIFESTVYPGLTEDYCVPILEKSSGLKYKENLFVGYSPERINPGDKKHQLNSIIKVVSGCDKKTLLRVDSLYSAIIKAGTHKAPSIMVAEAAKVIENTQRDINIALINELSKIFSLMEINTNDVLDAARTKWNFHDFRPGLVGGHCIGIDPYYLTYKAKKLGFHPNMILSGRETNESMPDYIVKNSLSALKNKPNFDKKNISALVLGLTFKENCPDVRNSKSIEVLNLLEKKCMTVSAFDPMVDISSSKDDIGLNSNVKILKKLPRSKKFSLIIFIAPHKSLVSLGSAYFQSLLSDGGIFYDVKGAFKDQENFLSL